MVLITVYFFLLFCYNICNERGFCMEELLLLYYEINNIYLELYKLELNRNIDSSMFIEFVNLLKDKINDEKNLIMDIIDSDDEMYNYLYDLDKDVDTTFAKRVSDYVRFNDEIEMEIETDEDIEIVKYTKLYSICSRNVFLIYMSFLQEYIDLGDDLREKLLNFKYCNAFINHDVEDSLVRNNFNVGKDNYVNLYFAGRLLKLDYDEVDKIIVDCLKNTIIVTISQLLLINDVEYNYDDKRAISVNNQCMLKAGLSILSEKEYMLFAMDVENIINKFVNDNNIISLSIVNDIIRNRKNNKCRVKKISLGLRDLED